MPTPKLEYRFKFKFDSWGSRVPPRGIEATVNVLDWGGQMPMVGQYLKARRGSIAYLITAVRPRSKSTAIVTCEETPPEQLPENAVVFSKWRWGGNR